MKWMPTTEHGSTDLERIDRGDYTTAVSAYRAGSIDTTTSTGALAAAECAAYLGDDARAGELLAGLDGAELLDDASDRGRVARRARLVLAEISYEAGDYASADERARAALEGARLAADEVAELRARFTLARAALRRGAPTIARERFAGVAASASSAGSTYYLGRAAYFLAYVAMRGDDFDTAAEYWPLALDALARTGGRPYAHALNVHGWYLSERGDDAGALALFDEADELLVDVGTPGDRLHVEANRARSLVLLGRAAEAAERYAPLVDQARRSGHPAEIPCLHWLAVALFDLGRFDEASAAALAMHSLASLVGDAGDLVAARLVGARARVAAGSDLGAVEDLEHVAHGAIDATGYQRAQAVLYLAEALASSDPTRAAALVAQARALPIVGRAARLRVDLAATERALARASVRVDGRSLVVNPDLGPVTVDRAVDAVTRFLLADALEREGGDVARASARVGLSRSEGYRLVKAFGLKT